jgi:hypothetical protein
VHEISSNFVRLEVFTVIDPIISVGVGQPSTNASIGPSALSTQREAHERY